MPMFRFSSADACTRDKALDLAVVRVFVIQSRGIVGGMWYLAPNVVEKRTTMMSDVGNKPKWQRGTHLSWLLAWA